MAHSKLYIIGTPLGNRNDITLRALEMLKGLTCFFAEDSRELHKLLEMYGIPSQGKKIHSYANHNMKEATEKALDWLNEGSDVGMVSDRGTPAISDPGALLVDRALEAGITVVPVPGPSSVTSVLSVCGFASDRFVFLGFLPAAASERRESFAQVSQLEMPVCFFESPKRVRKTLAELSLNYPEGRIFWGREVTKVYEEFRRFPLKDFDPENAMEKGEYTLVWHPGKKRVATTADWENEMDLRLASDKEWAKAIASRYDLSSSEIYNALQLKKRAK